jgi:uncharacterized protein YyaL (SSP411 family)
MATSQAAANHLVHETSPYLKQHAGNPVDWYPWGPEAHERARSLGGPIFLSIGYSACHWCHVMEHESFENEEIARILNEHFVSIKVDREERPDLDQIYMSAVQIMTGQGGWPMSVFLTPSLKPFYGGTYFPPDDRFGRPGFRRLLLALVDAWENRREEIERSAGEMTGNLQRVVAVPATTAVLGPQLLERAAGALRQAFDPIHGGFGHAPKFPHPMDLRLLLRVWKRAQDDDALQMVRTTLDHMAMGGIYDHLGGGFHRYSTDERWLVPHFEKMLYDNALLTTAYVEALQATGSDRYRQVVEETLNYVLREMTSPEGGFYSTQDADSEGHEGKFYVWSADEIEKLLGKERADVFTYVYDVTPHGNWEDANILHRAKTDEQDARLLRLPEDEMRKLLSQCRAQLYAVRGRRIWPGRDEKILTSWNALMIDAFAQAAQALDNAGYRDAAIRAADFLLRTMRGSNGKLFRTYSTGSAPRLNGYLEDYAFLVNALVTVYEASFEPRWIESALELTETMIDEFWDSVEGGFFYTGKSHEALIARTKDPHDSSIPSANAVAALALLRLAELTGRSELREKAEATIRLFGDIMTRMPGAAGQMLMALDYSIGQVQEFAIVGEMENEDTRAVLRTIRGRFLPNKVTAWKSPTAIPDRNAELLPLLKDKSAKGAVTTYICQNFACQAPLVGVPAVGAALE